MTPQDANIQAAKLKKYRELEEHRDRVRDAINSFYCENDNESPFTGDFRESRSVNSIDIQFSKTKGGAPATTAMLATYGLQASDLREFVRGKMKKHLEAIQAEMDAI